VESRVRTLKDDGQDVLFETDDDGFPKDSIAALKKVSRMALERYTELIDALCNQNLSFEETRNKTAAFDTIFANMLYLINHQRPAQGREILIRLLRQQVDKRKQSAANLRRLIEEGRETINAALKATKE